MTMRVIIIQNSQIKLLIDTNQEIDYKTYYNDRDLSLVNVLLLALLLVQLLAQLLDF